MTVEVVISWRPGCPYRERNLEWVLRQWAGTGWRVTLNGADDGIGWCRANDVTPVVEASNAEIIVCADADVWTEGIGAAVDAVRSGAAWAVPHWMLCRLSDAATERVIAGERPEDQDDFAERPYKGHPAGTLFVIRRDAYLEAPLDPGFQNWGQEDDAANLAWSLLFGKPWRDPKGPPAWHLWHPPQPRKNRGIGNDANLALYRRYRSARNDPQRMRALIAEFVEAFETGRRAAS